MVSASPQCQPEVKRQRTDKVNPMLLLVIKQISVMTEEDVRQTAIDQHAELLALRSQVAGRIRLIAAGIQPNPKSEVQISIENVISGPVKEGSFVAIQLPRWPPITGGLTP